MFFARNGSGIEGGCGFLSERQIEALLERGADPRLQGRFERHLRDGCAECLHLSAALERFREILERGALASEKARFQDTRHLFRTRLRYEVEASLADAGAGRRLSPEELQQISAAGDAPGTEPTAGEGGDDDDGTGSNGRG